jgi:hypothetical protein
MKTFILGAGASRHAGYPLAGCFDKDIAGWVRGKSEPSDDDQSMVDFLAEISTGRNFEDALETVTALVNTPREQLSQDDKLLRSYFGQQLAYFKMAIRTWFLELFATKSSIYDMFAKRLVSEGDTVISFNYDLALEVAMRESTKWQLRDGYGFLIDGFSRASSVQLLKLHGSINWTAVPFNGMRGFFQFDNQNSLGNRPVVTDYDAALLGYESEKDALWPGGGTPFLSPLILPARTKEFFFRTSMNPYEWVHFWDSLWASAERSLKISDHIFICGYSLPLADERARQLIFSSVDKSTQIEVSCGGDTARIASELSNAGFTNVIASDETYFEAWVQSRVGVI